MKTHHLKPQMCWTCGYLMDAASAVDGGQKPPKENDLSMCLNCGTALCMHDGQWRPATAEDTKGHEEVLRVMQMARAKIMQINLAKNKGGHT
jgi:hypothetical protein